jgi:hypothetical protein
LERHWEFITISDLTIDTEKQVSIWTSIFGPKTSRAIGVEIRPSGLLMDADGWYYEESLDAEGPQRTIRVQQDRPGDWYVRNTNCRIAELNSPSRASEVLSFFAGSFRWLRFEREEPNGRGPGSIRIIGTFLDQNGKESESHLGYIEPEIAEKIAAHDVSHLWGRLRCLRPPAFGRRPTFCLRFDLLVELDEKMFDDEVNVEARPEDFLPVSS